MQSASAVILIRPTGFGYDPETAESNAFQRHQRDPDVTQRAEAEFDGLLDALRRCGVGTIVLDPVDAEAPNAVFPNNWFSTHADGLVVIYPMQTRSRRNERDPHFRDTLLREGLPVEQLLDLSTWEDEGRILEGTGSLVLDRVSKLAFACLSPRTHEQALADWCAQLGYRPVPFTATMDGTLTGQPVYHTNVVMSVGTRFAVVCLEAMPYPAERAEVEEEIRRTGRELVAITLEQMHLYLGNLLELLGDRPGPGMQPPGRRALDRNHFLFLSTTAFRALRPDQRLILEKYARLVPVEIPTIEAVGGGSVRCMLAENFLPSASLPKRAATKG